MAFMKAPVSAGSITDSTPALYYNAKAGRHGLIDRYQDGNGEWVTAKTDTTDERLKFAVDFGRLEVGWIHFEDRRAPLYAMTPFGQPQPAEPEVPWSTAAKPKRCKLGFRVPIIGKQIGGVREFAGNSLALIAGMNDLHTEYEEAPEAAAGKLPLVQILRTREVRSGQATNYMPVFVTGEWVERPRILGPRTVAPPGAPAAGTAAAPRVVGRTADTGGIDVDAIHREVLARGRDADDEPPAGRWEDDAPPAAVGRPVNGTRVVTRARF